MAANRYRLRFTFWLDMLKLDEMALADQIEQLKNERSFVRTIRDGIRLIMDLRNGRTEVLFELFPWLKNELSQPMTTIISTSPDNGLQHQLDRLEQLILQQGAVPVAMPAHSSTHSGPKALDVPSFNLPTLEDDEDDTVVLKKDTSTRSATNFINSMLNLQQ